MKARRRGEGQKRSVQQHFGPGERPKMGITNTSKANKKPTSLPSLRWALKDGKRHPFTVQPLGNKYMESNAHDVRSIGLGSLALFPDPLLLDLVHSLDWHDLANVARCSKACMILVYHDEPYRLKTMLKFGAAVGVNGWKWQGNWRNTFKHASGLPLDGPPVECRQPYYSDTLFQSWYCANLDLDQFCPKQSSLPRIHARDITVQAFTDQFAKHSRPVVIEGILDGWKAFHTWTTEYLLSKHGHAVMRAESSTMTLKDYFAYASTTNEEAPLYIFDKDFAEKWNLDSSWYSTPSVFPEDLFSLLPKRPDYQWLILGPPRSGSTFHIDPNATSAFNAVLQGTKLWVFYPPNQTPPGIVVAADGSEVSGPVSVTEWFCNYIQQARAEKRGMMEGVQKAGDVVFVPSGWWHCVLNIDSTIAITQNFVAPENLFAVMEFLKNKRDQVSGYGPVDWCEEDPDTSKADNDLYEQFTAALQQHRPELYAEWQRHLLDTCADARKRRPLESLESPRSVWKSLQPGPSDKFSFGFSVE